MLVRREVEVPPVVSSLLQVDDFVIIITVGIEIVSVVSAAFCILC